METTGFIICSPECDTEEEAKAIFIDKLKWALRWLNGYKYWRKLPELVQNKNFEAGNTVYVMRARLVIAKSPIDGKKTASADEPFSNQSLLFDSDPVANIGFGYT